MVMKRVILSDERHTYAWADTELYPAFANVKDDAVMLAEEYTALKKGSKTAKKAEAKEEDEAVPEEPKKKGKGKRK